MSSVVNNREQPAQTPVSAFLQRLQFGRAPQILAVVLIGLLLAFLTIYPLVMLLYGSLHSTPPGMAGEFNLSGYYQLFTARNGLLFLNTVAISVAKTIPSLGLAIFLAWIIARTDTPFRAQLEVLITLPFFVPSILTAMAWGMLGNPQVGLINQVYQSITGATTPLVNIYSYGGIIWHMMQYSTPFLFLFIVDIFRAMDPSLEESARMSGASRWRTFRSVTFVLLLPAITNAFILSVLRGVENFESAFFFGVPANITVVTTEIYNAINQRALPDYQYATAISLMCMVLLGALVVGQSLILRGRRFTTVTGKGYQPHLVNLGRWRWVTFGFCVLFFIVTVVLPLGQLAIGSFFKFFGFYSYDMLTLDNYRKVLSDGEFWRGVRNTMLLGLVGATVTMMLGSLIAYISVRTTWPGRRLIETMAWLPWMMPGMVLGIGFLWAFALLPHSIPIYGTIWALLLAYVALGTPVSVRMMSSAFSQLSFDLDECARVHGASFLQTISRILVALAWPSFAVGWVLTFFGIMRELSASVLLYSAGSEVLSVVLMKLWINGAPEQVSVIGLMMMLLVIFFRWVQVRVGRRFRTF